jgi:hypothetical protein
MKHRSIAGLAGLVLGAALTHVAPAAADPVTVQLRIEGATRTIFEGAVTTDVRPFRFTGETESHTCDGTAATGGTSAAPVPTRGALMAQASETAPFDIAGTWHAQFGASFTSIDGESVAFDPATNRFLGEYENGTFASLGACADGVQEGDDVLFAYGDGSETLLSLSGPADADPGDTVTLRVADAASGAPIAGATVAGVQTGADGTAAVGPLADVAHADFKATRPGAIRSNRLRVCVVEDDCGVRGGVAPRARIKGIRDRRTYARRAAPRELEGSVDLGPAGLRAVRLSLQRKRAGKCWAFSGKDERFVRRRCGNHPAFSIGDDADWSYLLPRRLAPGRYDLRVIAVDRAGNRDRVRRGRSRVLFRVR